MRQDSSRAILLRHLGKPAKLLNRSRDSVRVGPRAGSPRRVYMCAPRLQRHGRGRSDGQEAARGEAWRKRILLVTCNEKQECSEGHEVYLGEDWGLQGQDGHARTG
jgi:hypothetical protein